MKLNKSYNTRLGNGHWPDAYNLYPAPGEAIQDNYSVTSCSKWNPCTSNPSVKYGFFTGPAW